MTFLESLVTRLSHELAAVQLAQGSSPAAVQSPSAPGQAATTAAAAAVTPGPPAPWLTDQQMLTPLLKAYDERVAAQEADMATAAREAEALHKQVGSIAIVKLSWEVVCCGLSLRTAHIQALLDMENGDGCFGWLDLTPSKQSCRLSATCSPRLCSVPADVAVREPQWPPLLQSRQAHTSSNMSKSSSTPVPCCRWTR